MRRLRIFFILILVLVIAYFAGPHPSTPAYNPEMPKIEWQSGEALEQLVKAIESQHKVKPDNEARIVWANDSNKTVTEYAIVYLHGFSASQEEGNPVHRNIAKKFGANLYLTRLAEHGLDTSDALINLTADKYWESAKEALAIGKKLGKKVILMGTSTGGSNALQLAATYSSDVTALVLLSPNIAIFDPNAWLLNNPWGLQIARMVKKSDFVDASDQRPVYKQYWYAHYRLEGAVALEEMLETAMTKSTFEKVKQPTLLLYYYKDEVHQDSVVKVSAMKTMFDQLGTSAEMKISIAMPHTGNHVMGSPIKSKDVEGVEREIEKFLREKVVNK